MTNEKQNGLTAEKTGVFKKGADTTAGSLTADKEKAAEKEVQDEDQDKKKTDPQEEMQGPISSIMQNIKEAGEATDVVSKEEANEKKDKNT